LNGVVLALCDAEWFDLIERSTESITLELDFVAAL